MAGKYVVAAGPDTSQQNEEKTEEEKILTHLFNVAIGNKPYGNARVVALLKHRNGTIVAPNTAYKKNSIPRTRGHVKSGAGNCAEINVIHEARERGIAIEGATIYVARAKRARRAGAWIRGLAKPCSHCEKVMRTNGIAAVVYTTDDDVVEIEQYGSTSCMTMTTNCASEGMY